MSRFRRWRQQMALRQRIASTLYRHKLRRRQAWLQRACLWYLYTWKGFNDWDVAETVVDHVVLAMLRWSRHPNPAPLRVWVRAVAAWR